MLTGMIVELYGKASRNIYSLMNAGHDVYCLMCGWTGKAFMKGGVCPKCKSMARHRLIPYAVQHFGLNFNQRLLHIGPNIDEVAYVLRHFLPSEYHRLDISPTNMVNLRGNLCEIPLSDNSIDVGFIWHVLEHVPNDRLAIKEMYRVLRSGATFLVSVPLNPPGREKTAEDESLPREKYLEVHGHHDHVRSCGLDYADRFQEVGFEINTLNVKDDVLVSEKQFFGLSDGHVAWCCTKR
jgi:SAM-dependent methyltransferase